jgi:hypothetical protein
MPICFDHTQTKPNEQAFLPQLTKCRCWVLRLLSFSGTKTRPPADGIQPASQPNLYSDLRLVWKILDVSHADGLDPRLDEAATHY